MGPARRNVHLVEAEYDVARLRAIREGAWLYLHGHSAGGTNPSLVEMMGFGVPDPRVGLRLQPRHDGQAPPTPSRTVPGSIAHVATPRDANPADAALPWARRHAATVAARRYRWDDVADAYFDLLDL
jgi:hypothetical protein